MYCNNCGKKLDANSAYCQFCGKHLLNGTQILKTEPSLKETVKINTKADYLKLIGFKVDVGAKFQNESVLGIVKDLSDDGRYLVLENLERRNKNKPILGKLFSKNRLKEELPSKLNVPLNEIEIVEVVDRFLKI